ncbi:carboxypeptidase-like regulatory domain-containing protein [Flavobacterium sp.]|uniref:carboxypeptidase-like regulatory domain-containing protein n=1 Tax=Flavobacterium sp. TaxID=239 RepID=UPI00260AE2D7|nr:carboxypeptidase-like regulatory domain-containing protein [Flavobacterium sp.]
MTERIQVWVLLLLSQFTFTQIKGVVVDENNKPISYVNIWIENENSGTTSEQDGSFTLDIKNQDKNLIFSAIGYKKALTPFKEKIVLEKEVYQLDEVLVSSLKQTQELEIGYYESNGFRYSMGYFIDAIYFKPLLDEREKYPFLKEIKFKTKSKNKNAKVRIYLVEVNKDGSPSENLLSEELFLEVKKGNSKNVIDLSKFKISIPENGFFIVFEKLKIEQNKHFEEYYFKDKNGKKKFSSGLSYQPEIPLVPIDEQIGWNKRINNKWEKSEKTTIQNPNSFENFLMKKYHNKYLVPSVNITLTN